MSTQLPPKTERDVSAPARGGAMASFIRTVAEPDRNILHVEYRGRVTAGIMQAHLAELDDILAGLEDGFVILTDLSGLESMDVGCSADLSRVMEKYGGRHVDAVIRIIPDPAKDIGFSILSLFHYPASVRIVTCGSAAEAERYLGESLERN